jgi:glycosyltransferase involved in cell wall biosynthesis
LSLRESPHYCGFQKYSFAGNAKMNNPSESPLVSIIVRTKDRPKLLQRAVQSIFSQTYRPVEVVLVNDGGCELDINEIRTVLGDIPLNYIRLEANTGRANAGNVGIENAKGDFIGFLDDDDEFLPEHIRTLAGYLMQSDYHIAYTDAFLVYKSYDATSHTSKDIKKEVAFSKDFNYEVLILENYIPLNCLLFDREVLINSGGFDPEFELYEDWDLLVRIGERHPFYHIKQVTANYNLWSNELQISQANRDQEFLRRSYLKVITKHMEKVTPELIHSYVSDYANARNSFKEYRQKVDEIEEILEQNEEIFSRLEEAIAEKDHQIKNQDRYIKNIEDSLRSKEAYIQLIHSGHGWKLLSRYFSIRDRLLPEGTKRRLFTKLIQKTLFNPGNAVRNLNVTNIKKFFYNLKTADPLAIEKKVQQKLTGEISDEKVLTRRADIGSPFAKAADRDLFSFMFQMNTKKGEDYVPISYPVIPKSDIKFIAFYLPQFHPIPENDEWWGKGFTEWTNVTRAVPQFIGHYQPRLPGELGFYDLRIPEVQQRQIELARQYGIYGFCFHFYWFDGKTLLEKPIMQFAENFDFPFCLNWANENWTRRWDGQENEILMAQKHSPQDDIGFIKHISKYLKNKNYIRINSKPLVSVYRPALLPNPKETAERWRQWCLNNGVGEIYLAAVHSFDQVDPLKIGFDAAVEFPLHSFPLIDNSGQFQLTNPDFNGVITNYEEAIDFFTKGYKKPPYKKFRGICPGWDNEARRPGKGTVIAKSTPERFRKWLKVLCDFTNDNFSPEERMIFINAWNEWAEGAYLEPDKRYGYAYLQAVADVLTEGGANTVSKKIIYVCHDALFFGAQLLSLNIIRHLKEKFHYDVHFILKTGGELEPEFAQYATVYNLQRDYKTLEERERLFQNLYNSGIRDAICNTVASGDLAGLLNKKGIRTITLIHELPGIIKKMGLEENARLLARHSDKIVFPSDFVRAKFDTMIKTDDNKTVILPQGLYKYNRYKTRKPEARKIIREQLSLPENAKIVLGVGYGDYRKGIDLFTETARIITQQRKDICFLWVGNLHSEMEDKMVHDIKSNKNIIFHPARKDVSLFYAGADIYLLPSREDPFPSVVLEAMDAGLPVIGFKDTGGFSDIVDEKTGVLVPYLDTAGMAQETINLLDDSQRMGLLGVNGSELIERKFNFTGYIYSLLSLLGHDYKKVSVIVPNYNYEKYLKLRINSILNQTYPVYEIIFLDDASTDNSVKCAGGYLGEGLNMKLVKNEINSGSVFRQWVKGLGLASGDYIWIAEADDLCENTFLEELMASFEKDKEAVLAYCQSRQIDETGKVLSENYFEYTNDISKEKWLKDYIREGVEEVADTLAVKNTIPNVSAVIFKKLDISSIPDEIYDFKVAGDWYFYVWLLKQGKISYIQKPLNFHRRHDRGVTKSENKESHYNEVIKMQEYVIKNFNVPVEVSELAHSYRRHIRGYFGL